MAVAFVNSGALASQSSGTSITPALPASIVAGNVLLAVFSCSTVQAQTLSAGWTRIGTDANVNWTVGMAYRVATGSGDDLTISSATSSFRSAQVFQYSGTSGVGANSTNSSTATDTHSTAGFTSTADNSASVLLDISVSASPNLTNPSGWTNNSSAAWSNGTVDAAIKTLGASGSASGATSTTGASWWLQKQIELLEAAPPATGTSTASIPQLTGSITGFTGNSSDGAIPQLTGSISGKRIFDEVVNSGIAIATDVGAGGLIELSASSIAAIASAGFPGSILTADANSAILLQSIALAPRVFVETAASGMTAATSGTATKSISLTGSSIFVAVSGGQAQAIYILSAESVAALMAGTQFVMDFTDGWAYNLNTGAPSFYEGMKFNSFAMIGGEYFGCNETGIHRLTGDKDGADDIRATITLGTSRLDSDREKTVPVAYVGARSAEPMVLTCRVEGEEYSYEFSRETAVMAPARVKPGKGLKGVYWEFEIENQNGADLDLDTLEVVSAPGSRRV